MNDSPRLSPSKAVKGWLTAAEHDTADSGEYDLRLLYHALTREPPAPLDPTKLSEDDQLRLAIEESLRESLFHIWRLRRVCALALRPAR